MQEKKESIPVLSEQTNVWELKELNVGEECLLETNAGVLTVAVLSGSILAGSKVIEKDNLFLVPSDTIHSSTMEQPARLLICRLSLGQLRRFEKLPETDYIGENIPMLITNSILSKFFESLLVYRNMGLWKENILELKREEFICLLHCSYPIAETILFFQSMLDRRQEFRHFIWGRWKQARNVEELAGMANLSIPGFMKKFKKCFNESPYQWMQKQKAKEVLEDITTGILPLKVVVNKYRFTSYAHLGVFCKRHYGFSPKELQNGKHLN